MCHLGLAQLEEHPRAIDHATSRRVEHPVADVLALEPLRRQEGLRHLAHHLSADLADVLRQDDARPPTRILEPHRVQVLGAEECAVGDDRWPGAFRRQRRGPRAVGEDRVRDGALEPVVEEVGGGADLRGDDEGAAAGERAQVVRRLLEGHHRRGAARVAHVDPLDIGPAAEAADQVGVEAGREPSGARRRREEIHVARLPAGTRERTARCRLAQLERAAPEPVLQSVHALVRAERGGVDIEVTPLDLTPAEEALALGVAVARERQQVGLREAMSRRRGRDTGDPWERHSTFLPSRLRVR